MRSVVLICSIGFLLLLVNSGNWLTQQLALRDDASVLEDSLSAFISYEMQDKRIPGISIVLIDRQSTLLEKGYGTTKIDQDAPATAYTVYRGGTLAQLFTTIAVQQRVQHNRLNLDEPVLKYLPWFRPANPFGLPLTLRQILSHQSGLPTEPPVGHYFDDTQPSLSATVNSLNQISVVYPPETFTKYSNAGFGVAGMVLEATLEKPFEQHMRAILDRMDLKRTSFSPRYDLRNKMATGYIVTLDGRMIAAPYFEQGNVPATNLYTTINDLGLFLKVIFADGISENGEVLDADHFEDMWTIQLATTRGQESFGLGLSVDNLDEQPLAFIQSDFYGFSGYVALLPDEDIGVAILANVEHASAALERIGKYALRLARAQRNAHPYPSLPMLAEPNPTTRRQATGDYNTDGTFYIAQAGEALNLYHNFARIRLRQQGDSLVHDDRYQYGDIMIADGVSLEWQNALYSKREPTPPASTAGYLAGLMGYYGPIGNPVTILERNGALYALKDWHHAYPLTEIAADTFALPDVGMYGGEKLVFERDETGVAMHVNFANMILERAPAEDYKFNYTTVQLENPIDLSLDPADEAIPANMHTVLPPSTQIVDLTMIDPLLNLDIQYAGSNNIFNTQLYPEARAFLQRPLAEALFRIQRAVRRMGLGLVIYDSYQPWQVTRAIWQSVPDSLKLFFDDPANGSCQNRGGAISLSLYNLSSGALLPMPSEYGALSSDAISDFPVLNNSQRWNRDLLRRLMESEGFYVSQNRWWHFEHQSCEDYPILNIPFDEIEPNINLDPSGIYTVD